MTRGAPGGKPGASTPTVPGTNTGHGHVWPRPDGNRARCGGPRTCGQCARDAAQRDALNAAKKAVIDAALRWAAAWGAEAHQAAAVDLHRACQQLDALTDRSER